MRRYRIVLRQRGEQFICYVVERPSLFGWVRAPFPFATLAEAERYAGADDREYETVVKESKS